MARRLLTRLAFVIAATLSGAAWPIGFGPLRASATMGQPLDVSVPLHVQPGESVSDSCISASVSSGDTPLPASTVRTQLINAATGVEPRVRVRTTQRIDEPFATVTVTVSCAGRVSRQFTVFADPPMIAPVIESSAAAEAAPALPAARPAPARSAQALAMERPVVRPRPARHAAPGAAPKTARAPKRPQAQLAQRVPKAAPPVVASAAALEAKPLHNAAEPITPSGGSARLRLDAPVVSATSDLAAAQTTQVREAEALATAKIAVDVAQAANNAAAQQAASIEANLTALRKESAEQKATIEKLRAAVDQSDRMGPWAPWLAAIALALAGLTVALYLRIRRMDAQRMQAWLEDEVHGPRTRQTEFDTVAPDTELPDLEDDEFARHSRPSRNPGDRATPAQAAQPQTSLAAVSRFIETVPSSTRELDDAAHPQDITIEELLDVEQQAEFFLVLGHDDSAADLLSGHIMATGGASPMPYLKLLEIFRRTGDEASYERTRKRFNVRFNGVAPEWGADPNAGRSLEDYPHVVKHIASVWADPVDAMAELQTLMFRNELNLLFDLPAYRDIMLLFTLARDLHEASAKGYLSVDVLLPLKSAAEKPQSPPAPTKPASPSGGKPAFNLVLDDFVRGPGPTGNRP